MHYFYLYLYKIYRVQTISPNLAPSPELHKLLVSCLAVPRLQLHYQHHYSTRSARSWPLLNRNGLRCRTLQCKCSLPVLLPSGKSEIFSVLPTQTNTPYHTIPYHVRLIKTWQNASLWTMITSKRRTHIFKGTSHVKRTGYISYICTITVHTSV